MSPPSDSTNYILIPYEIDRSQFYNWMEKHGLTHRDVTIRYHSVIYDRLYFYNKSAYTLWVLNPVPPYVR